MPVIVPDADLQLLTTAADVAAKMHVEIPTEGPDVAALLAAIKEASGIVLSHLNRDDVSTLRPSRRAAIGSVATRVAMRLWRNPADLSSESYADHSQAYSDPRLLTGDEIRSLSKSVARRRTPIMMSTTWGA